MNWFENMLRVNRARRIAKNEETLRQLQGKYKDEKTEKKILKLTTQIAKDKERQRIASENNSKQPIKSKSVTNNTSTTVNNGINTQIKFGRKKK